MTRDLRRVLKVEGCIVQKDEIVLVLKRCFDVTQTTESEITLLPDC